MNYKNKYLKYKEKYISLKKLKGGYKTWGFGIEQEFPINIKLNQRDKHIISQFGLSNNFINLKSLERLLKSNLVFISYQDIIRFDYLYMNGEQSIFKKGKNMDEFKEEYNRMLEGVNIEIKKFIDLREVTTLATIIILTNIHTKFIRVLSKYIPKFKINRVIRKYHITLIDSNLIYDDSKIKIYQVNNNIIITNDINYSIPFLDKDIGGFELRSDTFRNISVQSAVNEVIDKKNRIKKILQSDLNISPENILFIDKETMYVVNHEIKYSGELELNITLPYIIGDNFDESVVNFKNNHINLMKALQYLSPLFLACFTGTFPNSFGDNNKYLETSFRYKKGSRILVTDVENIYNLNMDLEGHYDDTHETIKKIYINHYQKNMQVIDLHNFEGKIEFSVNRNSNKFKPEEGKFFGFEWKIIDQYPIRYVNNITLLVMMLAQHLKDNNIQIPEDPREEFKVQDNSEWPYKLLEDCIYEGWNTYIGNYIDYINLIKSVLELDRHYIELDNKTAYNLLTSIHQSLFSYYRSEGTNTDIIDCFFPNFKELKQYNKLYDLPNINRNSYDNMIELMKEGNIDNFNSLEKMVIHNVNNEDFIDYNYYITRKSSNPFY